MGIPSPANLRAFVRRNTRLQAVPDVPGLRLHLADDITTLWHLAGTELGLADPPMPFWAFTWAGGLALAHHLEADPGQVAGLRVLDIATGSGLCAIIAARLGASSVHAVDVDPFSGAAVDINARANSVRVHFGRDDLLSGPPPDCDVILAGDVCYEERMAQLMIEWLEQAAERGIRVLIGDPGRRYFPGGLERRAVYRVRTSREIENADMKESAVFTFPGR